MKTIILFATVVSLILAAPIAGAQDFHIGPQLGFYNVEDSDDDFKTMIGGAVRVKFIPILGGEASINYRQEDYLNNAVTIKSYPVLVTGMLYPVEVLYGAVGFGWYNYRLDYSDEVNDTGIDDESEQEVGWHFGGGIQLPVGDRALVTGDLRYVFLDYDFGEVPGDGVDADFYMLHVGLLFKL